MKLIYIYNMIMCAVTNFKCSYVSQNRFFLHMPYLAYMVTYIHVRTCMVGTCTSVPEILAKVYDAWCLPMYSAIYARC